MSEDMSQIPERRAGWVFDKTVNVPTVLTIGVFAFTVIRWGGGIEADIQMLKGENTNRKEQQSTMIQSINKLADDNKQDMREMRQVLFAVKDEITKKK